MYVAWRLKIEIAQRTLVQNELKLSHKCEMYESLTQTCHRYNKIHHCIKRKSIKFTLRNTFLQIFSLKLYVGLGGCTLAVLTLLVVKEQEPWMPVKDSQTTGCTNVALIKEGSL